MSTDMLLVFLIILQKLMNLEELSKMEPTNDKYCLFLLLEVVIPQCITIAFYLVKNGWLFSTFQTASPSLTFIWMTNLEAAELAFFLSSNVFFFITCEGHLI